MHVSETGVRARYERITRALIAADMSISTMESCTAGQLASLITDTEGSSAILKGAFVTYCNEAKVLQGVPDEIIECYGVYSTQTAEAMARSCRKAYDAHIGVGVTGSFGNADPANADSVPGEVYFALASSAGTHSWHATVPPQATRLAYKLYMANVIADKLEALVGTMRETALPSCSKKPTTNVCNVIFDMGGVLMDWNPLGIAREFARDEADAELLATALFGQAAWGWLDGGIVDEQTVAWLAKRQLPSRLHAVVDEMAYGWYEGRTYHKAANDLAIRLSKEGYGIYLLTNAGPAFSRYCEQIPAYAHLRGLVVSSEEHLVKPDPRIFRLLCDRYALDPTSCLFVDDVEQNVAGARRAKMHGFHYTGDAAALERYIRSLKGVHT